MVSSTLSLMVFFHIETQRITLVKVHIFLTKALDSSSEAWRIRDPRVNLCQINVCSKGRHTFFLVVVFWRVRVQLYWYNKNDIKQDTHLENMTIKEIGLVFVSWNHPFLFQEDHLYKLICLQHRKIRKKTKTKKKDKN